MFDTEAFIYNALSHDASLLSLIGGVTHLTNAYPESIEVFPMVLFKLENQPDREFVDNKPIGNNCTFTVDIFTLEADTFPIANAVYTVFNNLFWACDYNQETPDPNIRVRHRIMRFNRLLFAGDML